jgi:hypothetical protein
MAALVEGELVGHPTSGLGLRLADGEVLEVVWAPGYSVAKGVLRDASGTAVAGKGDRVQVGGGQRGPWIACHEPGSVKVLTSASPGAP